MTTKPPEAISIQAAVATVAFVQQEHTQHNPLAPSRFLWAGITRLLACRCSETLTKSSIVLPVLPSAVVIVRLRLDPCAVSHRAVHHKIRERNVVAGTTSALRGGAPRARTDIVDADFGIIDYAGKVQRADFDSLAIHRVLFSFAQPGKDTGLLVQSGSFYQYHFINLFSSTSVDTLSSIELHVDIAHLENDVLVCITSIHKGREISRPVASNGPCLSRIPAHFILLEGIETHERTITVGVAVRRGVKGKQVLAKGCVVWISGRARRRSSPETHHAALIPVFSTILIGVMHSEIMAYFVN